MTKLCVILAYLRKLWRPSEQDKCGAAAGERRARSLPLEGAVADPDRAIGRGDGKLVMGDAFRPLACCSSLELS
jgi:hypothetical protein